MGANYVLIDYENVHPKNLELLLEHPFKVYVFVGENQAKIPFDLADSMQLLGKDAKYIKIAGSGQNALDFHIAYYVGMLAVAEPDAYFHIISKDKGFDPLIRHLKERKIRVQREKDLGEIPLLQLPRKASLDEKIAAIVKNLGGRGQSRPRKVKTLQNAINSLFATKLDQQELNELVGEMKKRKLIVVNQNNVSYKLPH
jgi:hypothetical protein